ncbi:hypothetical protein [Lederbergia lenta]|uniref:Uncharacterized protein n=1 Tax=Lederbergia lenta TaxID=1467 RepID=A0A2X4VHL9_LEDLE|nr:hypothetical protein [Lederbergia lenta]MCM3112604.1 hypothetical protein [Lederbergia lenta]MEC2323642.1 hypothetical protein [Lederbergia lenta]SQI51727.1 Uncharacterised protein [Lederbergia lenta]
MEAKEKLFWSIALPGFGQLLNGKYIKGIVFISLEFLINVQAHFNEVIISSFHGDVNHAINQADFQWLMFYPCLYFFAMWDAFKDAGGGKEPYSYLPFAFSAYFVTLGTIYSPKLSLFGVLLGPIWLPMLSVIPGIFVGLLLKRLMTKKLNNKD